MKIARILVVIASILTASSARADKTATALRLIDQGMSQMDSGELESAKTSFIKARDLLPQKANPHRLLGLVYARLGQCADADREFDQFIQRASLSDPRTGEVTRARENCRPGQLKKESELSAALTPPPPPPPAETAATTSNAALTQTAPPPEEKKKLPKWAIGVIAGVAATAVLGAAVGIGVAASGGSGPSASFGRVAGN